MTGGFLVVDLRVYNIGGVVMYERISKVTQSFKHFKRGMRAKPKPRHDPYFEAHLRRAASEAHWRRIDKRLADIDARFEALDDVESSQ